MFFTSRSARSARTAGPKITLRFPRLFVCASALITCAIYYIIRYYASYHGNHNRRCKDTPPGPQGVHNGLEGVTVSFFLTAALMKLIFWLLHPDPASRATLKDLQRDKWVNQPIDISEYSFEAVLGMPSLYIVHELIVRSLHWNPF